MNPTPALSREMERRFEQMGPAMRVLAARRLGINTTQPRIMAEMLRSRSHVGSAYRRLSETRAWEFVSVLVEHGGDWVPRHPVLESLSSRLREWLPFEEETTKGWRVEPEVAHAMARWVNTERFSLVTLLGRADEDSLAALLATYGIPARGAFTRRLTRLVDLIVASATSERAMLVPIAEETMRRGVIDSARIAGVRIPEEHGGRLIDLTLIDGTVRRVTSREIARALGVPIRPFDDTMLTRGEEKDTRLRIPSAMRIGALLTFASPKLCDDALRIQEFSDVVLYRLDDKRVATREECDHRKALAILQRGGLAADEIARSNAEVRDARD